MRQTRYLVSASDKYFSARYCLAVCWWQVLLMPTFVMVVTREMYRQDGVDTIDLMEQVPKGCSCLCSSWCQAWMSWSVPYYCTSIESAILHSLLMRCPQCTGGAGDLRLLSIMPLLGIFLRLQMLLD